MLFDSNAFREIYLVFMDDTEYRFSWMVKDGFKHVFAIERQALGWFCFDPSRSDCAVTLLPARFEHDVIAQFCYNNPKSTVLKIIMTPHQKSLYPLCGMISCVSTIQYYLGLYWPFVLTPYQLYTKLLNKPPHHIKVFQCQAEEEPSAKRGKRHNVARWKRHD